MPNYAHKLLAQRIAKLDQPPADQEQFAEWIEAGEHLAFLRENAVDDEIVIYGSGTNVFVHSMVVPNESLSPVDEDDLLTWGCNPFTHIASTVYGRGDDVRIERGPHTGCRTLDKGRDLVFARTFEGWADDEERTYFEINQEYTHLSGIHWRPEYRSYCRFNGHGDLEHVISVTNRHADASHISLVSFEWDALERYLALSRSSLVRMFDFTLLHHNSFNGWSDDAEERFGDAELFGRQKISAGIAAYTRGVQIIRPRYSHEAIFAQFKSRSYSREGYVEFIAHDWRNGRITKISTDPAATTNYFVAKENQLPFEVSPAFFRPEVLSKYKTDREKYTVGERDIHCRAAWTLRGYDVNEAGQVHAYICYLRNLPYAEQLHWLSFNEEPKAPVPTRAIAADFEGRFVDFSPPLRKILSIVRRWNEKGVQWWVLRDGAPIDSISAPVSASRDEWSEAFMDLSKIVVEGFDTSMIRKKLDEIAAAFGPNDQSIVLLEKLHGAIEKSSISLTGLRAIQRIRSKIKGHAGSSEAKQIVRAALAEHESFAAHFNHVCGLVAAELEVIERMMAHA